VFPGLINLDFADVKTIMSGMGLAMMGTGVSEGQDRAIEAARRAISSPLLEGASVNGARGVIINVTGGPDLSLVEVSEASSIVQEAADEDANIIFGAVVDPALKGKVKITVIATGFGAFSVAKAPAPAAASSSVTPVDMTQYAEQARARTDSIAVAAAAATPRLSFGRRPLLDLTNTAKPAASTAAAAATAAAPADQDTAADPDRMRRAAGQAAADSDFDLSSTFDVPAFLRRQEG